MGCDNVYIYFSRFMAEPFSETMVRRTWSNHLTSDDGDTAVFSVKSFYKMNLEVEDLLRL